MTARSRHIMALGGLMLLGACADDDGFAPEGAWRVQVHTLDSLTCGDDGSPVQGAPPYLRIARLESAGAVFWQVQDCDLPEQCAPVPADAIRYQHPIAGGYGGTLYAARGAGASCVAEATTSGMVIDGDVLTIRTRYLRAILDDASACTPEVAARAQEQNRLECVGNERVTAVRVAP